MRIVEYLDEIGNSKGVITTFGMFDGLHIGHQAVIERLIARSRDLSLENVVISFESHPLQFLEPDRSPPLLTPIKKKVELLRNMNIDMLLLLKFGARLSELSPEQFVKQILIDKLKSKAVVVGYDCAFGKNRSGNAETLELLGKKYNFLTEVVPPQKFGDIIAHSTVIRKSISEGDMELFEALLGRKYSILGRVIPGKGRGQELGFPTANVEVENQPLSPSGVYAIWAIVNGKKYEAVLNMGWQPSLGKNSFRIEAHLLDFDQDIYGEGIEIIFVKKLREEKRFESLDDLANQIKDDIMNARKILVEKG